jgi:plasmid stabilization system protein ParE
MKRTLLIQRRAESDVERIYRWLAKRSLAGAVRWHQAYVDAIVEVGRATRYGLALRPN